MVKSGGIDIRKALRDDAISLSTIIPRSFGPDEFLNQIFPPESEAIRKWWVEVYTAAIELSNCHILLAVHDDRVVGVLTLHIWRPEFSSLAGPGILSLIPLTRDHDPSMQTIIESQAEIRRKIMNHQPNYLIDLMAVDRRYQGNGIGKRLLRYACEIADEDEVALFLQTTKAKSYYVKAGLGFESDRSSEEPSGWVKRSVHHGI